MGKTLLQELRDGEYEMVWSGTATYMVGYEYETRLGRHITVYRGYSTSVTVNGLDVGWWFKHRILRAMKKGAEKQ